MVKTTGEKPVAGAEVKLYKGNDAGPVIGKGRTNGKGTIDFSGTWTAKNTLCATAYADGHGLGERCEKPWPKTMVIYLGP